MSIAEVIAWPNDDEDNCSFGKPEDGEDDESSLNVMQRKGF